MSIWRPVGTDMVPVPSNVVPIQMVMPRRPRILLAASGSVAAVKFGHICHCFIEWADVKAVVTRQALRFMGQGSVPGSVELFIDDHEWSVWRRIGDRVLHIELSQWADMMVISPLSANTLAKIAGGLCDNLLTCVVRAWDYSKPVFIAPSMNTSMWKNPFTEQQLVALDELGMTLIPPTPQRMANGEYGNGAMAEATTIYSTVRLVYENRRHSGGSSSNL